MASKAQANTGTEAGVAQAVLLIGKDSRGQAHAACFNGSDTEAAQKSATTMGVALLKLETKEQLALADKMPRGKLYPTGRAFLPYIREAMFNEWAAFFPAGFEWPVATDVGNECMEKSILVEAQGSSDGGSGTQDHWLPPVIGEVVLACEDPGWGWFEAEVVRIDENGLHVLKWRDYPNLTPIVRRAEEVALLHAKKSK